MVAQRSLAVWGGLALAIGLAAGGLAGCSVSDPKVTIGRDFPFARLVAIREGKSSKRQVEGILGKPYKVDKLGPRRERWRYYSREESVKRFLFIPLTTYVVEREVRLAFDGAFVESIDKQQSQYTE